MKKAASSGLFRSDAGLSGFLYTEEKRTLALLQFQQCMAGLAQKRLKVTHRACVCCLYLYDLPCRHAVKGLFQLE